MSLKVFDKEGIPAPRGLLKGFPGKMRQSYFTIIEFTRASVHESGRMI